MKQTPPLFELRDVSVSFSDKPIFTDLSFSVKKGEKLILRGPSGCGKSTVLKLLLGLVQADQGAVLVRGQQFTPDLAWQMRRETAYAGQKIDAPPEKTTDFITSIFDFTLPGNSSPPPSDTILQSMRHFGLPPEILKKNTQELSGGELQRLILTSIILPEKSIYLLDEPSSALDHSTKEKVAEYFLSQDNGITLIVASHDEVWNRPDRASIMEFASQSRNKNH